MSPAEIFCDCLPPVIRWYQLVTLAGPHPQINFSSQDLSKKNRMSTTQLANPILRTPKATFPRPKTVAAARLRFEERPVFLTCWSDPFAHHGRAF